MKRLHWISYIIMAVALMCALGGCAPSSAVPVSRPAGDTVYIRALKVTAPMESLEPVTQELPARETDKLGFVEEKGRWYYYAEPGVRYQGWIQTEEGYSYFNEERIEGLYRIGEDVYYFPNGIMATGPQLVRGVEMVFDEVTGRLISSLGDETEEAEETLDVPDGWWDDESARYYIQDGKKLTGKQLIDEHWYYFMGRGGLAQGFIVAPDGAAYYAGEDGWLLGGFVSTDEGLRYFDPETYAMVRNATVGSYSIDGEGVCHSVAVEVTDANLDAYVDSLLMQIGTSPLEIYEYVRDNYVYVVMGWDSVRNMAIHMFNTGYGACIHFCAITEMLLNHAGYATQWVRGELGHYWLLVEMSPGVWRHMDTMRKYFGVYNLTDEEMVAKHDNPYDANFRWDQTKWTSTTPTGNGGVLLTPPTSAPPETTTQEAETTTEEPETATQEAETTTEPASEESSTESEEAVTESAPSSEPAAQTSPEPETTTEASSEESSESAASDTEAVTSSEGESTAP